MILRHLSRTNCRISTMVIAYHLSVHDDGAHMLGPDTFRVPRDAGFYDWRFGCEGVPHPATCATCGRKTDAEFINPGFRVRKRSRDLTVTYDGFVLVSLRFRNFCETTSWIHDVELAALPNDPAYFRFRPLRVIEFDAERRGTRFEEPCPECGKFFNVVGATPVWLRNVREPIVDGVFRTDLEFGSGHEQSPLIIIGTETAAAIKDFGFEKVDLKPVRL